MSAVIQGAVIAIEIDLEGAWTDITCDATSAEYMWGAPEALGPLTECEGGTLRVSLYDPDRVYDPDNPDSPAQGGLKVGAGMRVLVDGSPAWTGVLQTWGWDRASEIADLNALDPIGQLSVRAMPQRETLMGTAATSGAQAAFMLDRAEWPLAKRWFPAGNEGWERGNHYVEGPAIDGLHRIRFAELGRVYPMRDGRIAWLPRAGMAPAAPTALINCGGVGLTDMWKVLGLGRVRNHVVISGGYGVYGPVLPPDEYRAVTTTHEFLQFAYAGVPAPNPWEAWGQHILDALADPPPLTMLGTMLPQGAQVKQVLCSEFGTRWTVANEGQPDVIVEVIGMRVTLAPGNVLEVDVVTSDVAPIVPSGGYRAAIMATSGLVGYWRIGEASTASPAADERGIHPGTYSGVVLGQRGAVDDDNGAGRWVYGDYLSVPHAATLNLADAWSIEAWVKLETVAAGLVRGIVGKGAGGYYLRVNAAGNLELARSNIQALTTSTTLLPAGAWTHVVGTKSGATSKLYINGVDRTGTVTNSTTANNTLPLTIGADADAVGARRDFFAGSIDDVSLYSRALTPAEVLAHYDARL